MPPWGRNVVTRNPGPVLRGVFSFGSLRRRAEADRAPVPDEQVDTPFSSAYHATGDEDEMPSWTVSRRA